MRLGNAIFGSDTHDGRLKEAKPITIPVAAHTQFTHIAGAATIYLYRKALFI